MKVRFWGTRGSIATPGPGTNHFGGNTSCVEITTAVVELLVLDCGTGARPLGVELMAHGPKPLRGSILLGHTHWDHIQGFPFFAPLFVRGNEFAVYAPEGSGRSLQEVLAGQMEFSYFPVELGQLPADITYHDLVEGAYEVGGAWVVSQYLNHPAMTLGYRVEADDATVVYLADHEPFSETLWRGDSEPGHIESILHEGDRRHARFMADADLVIHDAQYTPEEYRSRKTWGHSTYEYVVEVAAAAGVRRLALTHHDQSHDDTFVAEIEERAREVASHRGSPMEVFCAYEGCEVSVEPHGVRQPFMLGKTPASAITATSGSRILVVDDDRDIRLLAMKALKREGHAVIEATNGFDALRMVEESRPDLVVLALVMPGPDGLEVLKVLRSKPETTQLPVLVLTAVDDESTIRAGFDLGATDYLMKPFTIPQLTARVRACLARAARS